LCNLLENTRMKLPSNLRNIFLQRLVSLELNFISTFRGIYQATNGLEILPSYLPHRPLLNKKKKTILTLPVTIP